MFNLYVKELHEGKYEDTLLSRAELCLDRDTYSDISDSLDILKENLPKNKYDDFLSDLEMNYLSYVKAGYTMGIDEGIKLLISACLSN